MKKTNTTVSVCEKTIYSEDGKRHEEEFHRGTGEHKEQALDHVSVVSEFNCNDAKARSLSMVIYDIDGKRVAGSPAGGSHGGILLQAPCMNGSLNRSANRY